MFQLDTIQVPVLGIVENMAYFTPEELPENKYYIFGKDGAKNLADDLNLPYWQRFPRKGIRESADIGRPVVLQEDSISANAFIELADNVVEQIKFRNENISPHKQLKYQYGRVLYLK